MSLNNPLLDFSNHPLFDAIQPAHIAPALDQLLPAADAALEKVTAADFPAEWKAIAAVLDVATEKLSRAWGAVSHLHSVADTPELRAAYTEALPRVTEFYTRLGADERLYAKYKAVNASKLDSAQQQALINALRNFVLGGAELQGEDKARYAAIQEKMAEASQKFSEHALDATDQFALYVNESELEGVPEDVKNTARSAAEKEGKEGYKLTLKMPCYLPVMQFAKSSDLRHQLYKAYVTRASDQADAKFAALDNSSLIQEILQLRLEEAKLLGYQNFAQVSVATKMAESPQQVEAFLQDLADKAKPYALRDKQELEAYAKKLGINDMQAWDVSYASEKLREEKYAFSDLEVKQYFPEDKVLSGLFKVVETIFAINVIKSQASVWHDSASFYDIKDAHGHLIGQFYLDLYARNNKRGGAWMDEAITRRKVLDQVTTPVAFLTCNFSAPVGDKPALFTHDEVLTMFHEFGHGIHHMLTKVDDYSVSGIKGVEWDAVELPSQFMENFCWEWDVLRHMTAHVETGEQLPRALFDKMVAAKNFQAGMQTVRQIEFSLFDIRLHGSFDPHGKKTALDLIEEVRDEVAVVRPPKWNRFPNNFTHIFSGGYSAGYYSYKWAEVLSADAYSLFEENGVLCPETGQRYWQEILAQGGSRPALESFTAFRGRAPNIDALLRHNGMN